MNISWYNSIPVLKNGIRNTVFYSATNRKPVILIIQEFGGEGDDFREVWWGEIRFNK